MIQITGTDKQVKWATDLREKALAAYHLESVKLTKQYQRQLNKGEITEADLQIALSAIETVYALLSTQSDAKWWIDNMSDAAWRTGEMLDEAIEQAFAQPDREASTSATTAIMPELIVDNQPAWVALEKIYNGIRRTIVVTETGRLILLCDDGRNVVSSYRRPKDHYGENAAQYPFVCDFGLNTNTGFGSIDDYVRVPLTGDEAALINAKCDLVVTLDSD